ncbi:MAG: hypothetical protein AAF682_11180 [Planctomycetota bacterium]
MEQQLDASPLPIEQLPAVPPTAGRGALRSADGAGAPRPRFGAEFALILVSVLAAEAIVRAVSEFLDASAPVLRASSWTEWRVAELCWPIGACLLVTVTTIRFYHGNVIWYIKAFGHAERPSQQSVFPQLSCFYVHVLQYGLFYLAAAYSDQVVSLALSMALISLVDVLWTAGAPLLEWKTKRIFRWRRERDGAEPNGHLERHAELERVVRVWKWLNAVTLAACVPILVLSRSNPAAAGGVLCVAFLLVAVLDYGINREFFFGRS